MGEAQYDLEMDRKWLEKRRMRNELKELTKKCAEMEKKMGPWEDLPRYKTYSTNQTYHIVSELWSFHSRISLKYHK